jgi:hypothetical protein
MTTPTLRERLRQQINDLPDDVVEQIADFTLFLMTKRQLTSNYIEWDDSQWQEFALEQLFSDDDEIEYCLEDAQEIYKA